MARHDRAGADAGAGTALRNLELSILQPLSYESEGEDDNVSGPADGRLRVRGQCERLRDLCDGVQDVRPEQQRHSGRWLNNPILDLASIKPEDTKHIEIGLKTEPLPGVVANITAFHTDDRRLQVSVVSNQAGTLRGYLANAEQVIVQGVEFDGSWRVNDQLQLLWQRRVDRRKYESFTGAPPALEDSGGACPRGRCFGHAPAGRVGVGGFVRRRVHAAGEFSETSGRVLRSRLDASYRSEFSSSPPSRTISTSTATRW
jgi:iron complex outermembrane receptor protein